MPLAIYASTSTSESLVGNTGEHLLHKRKSTLLNLETTSTLQNKRTNTSKRITIMSEQSEKDQVEEVSGQPMKKATTAPFLPQSPESHSEAVEIRLDLAIAAAKPVNRSADLVLLELQFDKMKKQLSSVIAAAKIYHDAMLNVETARMKVCMSLRHSRQHDPALCHMNSRQLVSLL